MAWFLVVLFNIMVCVFLFLYVRFTLQQALKADVLLRKVRGQMDQLIRELNQVTDRNLNLVEIRLESLTNLMEEANTKMEIFEGQIHDWQHQREQLEILQTPEEPTFSSPVNLIRQGNKIAFGLDHELRSQSSVVLQDRSYRDKETVSSLGGKNDRRLRDREAVTLFRQGISLEMISKKLKMDLGEVELIISLRVKDPQRFL